MRELWLWVRLFLVLAACALLGRLFVEVAR